MNEEESKAKKKAWRSAYMKRKYLDPAFRAKCQASRKKWMDKLNATDPERLKQMRHASYIKYKVKKESERFGNEIKIDNKTEVVVNEDNKQ